MTTIVGILNKKGVAIAADSAVTMTLGDGQKISNTANKLFSLSKREPIGIAVYGSDNFMEVPWEVMIKDFRSQLGDNSFDFFHEYFTNFLEYFRIQADVLKEETKLSHLYWVAKSTLEGLVFASTEYTMRHAGRPPDDFEGEPIEYLENTIVNNLIQLIELDSELESRRDILEDFNDYTFEEFYTDEIEGLLLEVIESTPISIKDLVHLKSDPKRLLPALSKLVFHIVTKNVERIESSSGLFFAGYGSKQLFPSFVEVKIGVMIGNRIQIKINQHGTVEPDTNIETDAYIVPMAQTDVIETFLNGISPLVKDNIGPTFNRTVKSLLDSIAKSLTTDHPEAAKLIQEVSIHPTQHEFYNTLMLEIQNRSTGKMLWSISSLSKKEMASMAEALINLTSLKRKVSFAKESVGGPIDVAVISKHDGFVWIKRKHYFDPDLNHSFFKNYFH